MSTINKNFRNTITANVISMCGNEQHDVHAIRIRFTRKGNKWFSVLDRMINTGKAKSGKTMRQIYRYCQVWLSDIGATDFGCPKFNPNANYAVDVDDEGKIFIHRVA